MTLRADDQVERREICRGAEEELVLARVKVKEAGGSGGELSSLD
jgi:hypothetical protein